MKHVVGIKGWSVLAVKWKTHIRVIFIGTNDESSGVRALSGFIKQRNVNSVKGAMPFQLGAEFASIMNILLWHPWISSYPGLLLFFGAWCQIEFESRLGDMDFLANWREENEIPLFLLHGDGVNSETVPKSGY